MRATWVQPTISLATSTRYLALFSVLVIGQTAHLLEHVAQMVQIHLLDLVGSDTRGVVGQLDIEWVHFVSNALVVVILGVLLVRDRGNRLLAVACLVAGWHLVEHDVIMVSFLATGIPGSPGLLAAGGAIAGGLPLSRADLHFLYNLAETALIIAAFVWRLRAEAPSGRYVSSDRLS